MEKFWIAVVEDLIANLATAAVLILGGVLWWYGRLGDREQYARRWLSPPNRVMVVPTEAPREWASQTGSFALPIRSDERQRLVTWYSRRMHTQPTNGAVVRLDSANPWRFSTVEFFDFLATNLTAFPANWPRPAWSNIPDTLRGAMQMVPLSRRIRQIIGTPQSGEEVLSNRHLANPLSVSVLLQDATGRWGIVARSHKVAVSSGQWGATAAGTLSPADLDAKDENPIAACARREVYEELGMTVGELQWDGLVIARQKMQPIALLSGRIARSWEEMAPLIQRARDWHFENTAFYAVPSEHIPTLLRTRPLTDAAAYHLSLKRNDVPTHLRRIRLDDDCIIGGHRQTHGADAQRSQ